MRVSSGTRADRGHQAGSWEGGRQRAPGRILGRSSELDQGCFYSFASTNLEPRDQGAHWWLWGVTAMPRPSRRCLSSYLSHSNNNKKLLMSFLSTDGQTEARMIEAPCLKLKGGVGSQSSELILLQFKLHGRLTLLSVA